MKGGGGGGQNLMSPCVIWTKIVWRRPLTPSHTTARNYRTGLASSVGVLATPLIHDVELWMARQSGESRALTSV